MEKSVPNASVRKNINKSAVFGEGQAEKGGRLATFMWLSRFFNALCFLLVFTASVLSLSLIHIAKEADVDSVLVTAPMFSDNLAYFEPLHPDMPTMDVLAEMFVRQYVTVRNSVWPNERKMRYDWGPGGIINRMSTYRVYETFVEREAKHYYPSMDFESTPAVVVDTNIKKIIKEGWNSWQLFFDTRKMAKSIDPPEIEHWIATIQFRYYASNAFMRPWLRNPLGFTVTQYHLARQKQ